MADVAIHLRARFDGRALVPEEPADLPVGVVLDVWANLPGGERLPELGTAAGRVRMADDFDATPAEFEGYL